MDASPSPRPRNAAQTKARIVAAAQLTFARSGYAKAGLREIAAMADVTSALLVRYFGSKAGLFEAALIGTLEANSVFTWEKRCFGTRMAALVRDGASIDITAMLVLALADPDARPIATRVARDRMIAPLASWLGPPHALARALNMFGVLTGFAIQNQAIVTGGVPDYSLQWLARTLQAIVDETAAPEADGGGRLPVEPEVRRAIDGS